MFIFMKILLSIVLLGFLGGCSFSQYVDAKGRDCRNNQLILLNWTSCEEEQEALAISRQETILRAEVNGLK